MRGHFLKDQGYLWSALVPLGHAGETRKLVGADNWVGFDCYDPAGHTYLVLRSNQSHQDAGCRVGRVHVSGFNPGKPKKCYMG